MPEYNKLKFHFIKYSGSKRNLAPEIMKYIPKNTKQIVEPFCGSAAFSFTCMHNNIPVEKYILSDLNQDIINLLKKCKEDPFYLIEDYKEKHIEFNKDKSIESRKKFFNETRLLFNTFKDPADFLFLTRTCVNGLILYNNNDEFNTSCHFSRSGIDPYKLAGQILYYNKLLNNNNVEINHDSYENREIDESLYFIDPPYLSSKEMYLGNFNSDKLKEWVNSLKNVLLTHDEGSDYFQNMNIVNLKKQNSSFHRLHNENKKVSERLFYRLCNE